jgi:hypothetical protein
MVRSAQAGRDHEQFLEQRRGSLPEQFSDKSPLLCELLSFALKLVHRRKYRAAV